MLLYRAFFAEGGLKLRWPQRGLRHWHAYSSEGAKYSALPGFQSKISNTILRQRADRGWYTPRDCIAGDSEGFVRIIDGSCNDTPTQILADFRIGPRNKHHPTLHVSLLFYDEQDSTGRRQPDYLPPPPLPSLRREARHVVVFWNRKAADARATIAEATAIKSK